jgi:hypothetical protein
MAITDLRDFATADPVQLNRQLQRLVQELDQALNALKSTASVRLLFAPETVIPGETIVLKLGYAQRVLTAAASAAVRLPQATKADAGLFCGVLRMSGSNTLTVYSQQDVTVNGASSVALAAGKGLYLFWFDGSNWHEVRS